MNFRSGQLGQIHSIVATPDRRAYLWENSAIESFFSSLKTERVAGKFTEPVHKLERMSSITLKCFTIRPGDIQRWVMSIRPV